MDNAGLWFAHADLKNVHSLEVDSLRSVYFDMKQKQAAESKKDATVNSPNCGRWQCFSVGGLVSEPCSGARDPEM